MLIFETLNYMAVLGTLRDGMNSFVNDWLGPAFLLIAIFMVVKMVANYSLTKLLGFLVFAILGSILIFRADGLLGSNGSLTRAGERVVDQVGNTITFVDESAYDNFVTTPDLVK